MDLSIVIPLYNESTALKELVRWIEEALTETSYEYEIIFIDDGSTDDSWSVIQELIKDKKYIRAISFRRNHGKSAALNVGFNHVQGDIVITMDADLQDNPEEIPGLCQQLKKHDYDIVSGWKKHRQDPYTKTIPSKFFNWVTRNLTGIPIHDFNCGLKAYRQSVVRNIEVYGEMHRYIPVIAKWAGFTKIGEKVVKHQPRPYGTTKFGLERFINGFLDLLSIMFVGKFGKRPMHLFGTLGVLVFFIGFLILIYLVYTKFVLLQYGMDERPLFYLGILTVIVGTQLFLTGFLAELVSRNAPDRNQYYIDEKVNIK